ncbi:hypothetical protein R1sor_003370 [Riccia sorocarpa]|uniref:Uncharacterized protein n=1 Tax=Riccia sorocarpa TaxID=122646 RepID=A0ABD3H1S6_9MARC
MNTSGAFGGNGVLAYMTGNQGWTYTMQHPNAWMQVTCDQNEARRNRRAAKRKFQEEMTQRKEQGLKPCKVTVDHRGYVEGGKDEWYPDLKALCLNYLDISIPQFAKQNTARVQLVKRDLGDRYQYDGGELSDNFVKGKILQILKGERNRLKMLWEEVGESKLDTPCPEDVEPTTWKKLIQYWTSAEGMVKSDQASSARAQVVNLNTTGCAGYHSSIRQMEKGCSPTLKEAKDSAYTPTGNEGDTGSIPKLSGSIPHRISSVEDSIQKYIGDLQKLHNSVDAQEPGYGEKSENAPEVVAKHEDPPAESHEEEQLSDVSKKVQPPLQPNTIIPPQSRTTRRKQVGY